MKHSPIPYAKQSINDEDIAAVVDVLKSPYLTTGPKVKEFENAVAKKVGAAFGVAVSSGTAGLHAAMAVAGIKPGDEVLVSTMSFLASSNCVLYMGAKPVFVDSLPKGFNLDPADAAKKITSKTKALVAVDFAGEPADWDALLALARKHKLVVIEDAAHALGAVYRSKPVGSFADMTVFSFHPVKHITTGEGGLVTTNNEIFAKQLRKFRHHGIDVDVVARDAQKTWKYDMVELGYNLRLSDIQCALGISQLKRLDLFLSRRDEIVVGYDKFFGSLPFVDLPPRPSTGTGSRHAWHLYILSLRLDKLTASRDEIFSFMREAGIGVHVHYKPIHLHPYYSQQGYKKGDCPQAELIHERMLTVPLYADLTDFELARVETAFQDCFKRFGIKK